MVETGGDRVKIWRDIAHTLTQMSATRHTSWCCRKQDFISFNRDNDDDNECNKKFEKTRKTQLTHDAAAAAAESDYSIHIKKSFHRDASLAKIVLHESSSNIHKY